MELAYALLQAVNDRTAYVCLVIFMIAFGVHDFETQRYVSFESMYAMFVLGSTIFEIVIGDD